MGLKGGEHGVKALFRRTAADAFYDAPSLSAVRDAVCGAPHAPDGAATARARVVAVLDGNVLLMSVPESMRTFDELCAAFAAQVDAALRCASVVLVVFDEPEHTTEAKRDEQRARDAARAARQPVCSDDVSLAALSVPGTLEELRAHPDVHALKAVRSARTALYDAVCHWACHRYARRCHEALDADTVVFDGLDPRGFERAPDVARAAWIVGFGARADAFEQREERLGEGDLKLVWAERRVRELARADVRFVDVALLLVCTIDTDVLMTSLLQQAELRHRAADDLGAEVRAVVCMRNARGRAGAAAERPAYACCDPVQLERRVCAHLWPTRTPADEERALGVAVVCAAAAACGCDFTRAGVPGARFDHVWDVLPAYVASQPLAALRSFDARDAPDAAPLRALFERASASMRDKPRYKRQARAVADALEATDAVLRRALWSVAYWRGHELPVDARWGF
jgi:hypothetical protein